MRERQARLLRLVRLFELAKQASETRQARLKNADSTRAQRELDLMAAMSASSMFAPALQQMSHRKLAAIARERELIRNEFEVENARRLEAERRVRAAARSLERVEAEIECRAQRLELEEVRLGLDARGASSGQALSR